MWHHASLLILPSAIVLGLLLVQKTLVWGLARRWNNYGIVDVVWSASFAWMTLVYLGWAAFRHYDAKLDAYPEWHSRGALLMTGAVLLWSLRLAGYLGWRVYHEHPKEDRRYAELRREWGPQTSGRMLQFYLLQGVMAWILGLPFLLACFNDRPPGPYWGFQWNELLGLFVWMLGWFGESVADAQLRRFRKRSHQEPGHVICQEGLWRYSRHPNYFFEWVIWVGFALMAFSAPAGWLGLLSPLLMWHFLVNVTGIPMTEALSVASKGDAYRRYQRTTNAFFPGPTREESKKP